MRAHFPAAHFVDVISSSIIHHFPVWPAAPGRHSGAHRVLRSGHPAACLVPARKNELRAGPFRKRPPLIRVFLLSGTSPPNFSLPQPHGGGKKTHRVVSDCRDFVTSPAHFCSVWWDEVESCARLHRALLSPSGVVRNNDLCHRSAPGRDVPEINRAEACICYTLSYPYFSMCDVWASPNVT